MPEQRHHYSAHDSRYYDADACPIGPVSYVDITEGRELRTIPAELTAWIEHDHDILHAVERDVSQRHARAWPRVVTVAVEIRESGRTYSTRLEVDEGWAGA